MSKSVAVRSDGRYELVGNQFVMVTIDGNDHRLEPITVDAQLLNLSSSGAKLSVPLDLPQGKLLQIKLVLEKLGMTMYVSGTVCWSKKSEHASVVGCKLNPILPTSVLEHISQSGCLDRRDGDRRPSSCAVKVIRRGLLRSREEPAELHNYAAGGICLAKPQPAKLGERLAMRVGSTAKIEVIVRWQLQQGEQCLLGCQYVSAASFQVLKTALGD